MLELTALDAHRGHGLVLRGVDLRVGEGEIVALLGRNGAGRSTMLEAIMGRAVGSGSVRFRGREILGLPTFQIARLGIGHVPEGRDVFPTLSVEQNLMLGLKPARHARRGAARWPLDDIYRMFPALRARRRHLAGVLSGGEQQMLAIGRTLLGDPDLLLVDEPTEGLAPALVERVAETLTMLRSRGVAVLLVEQKLAIALRVSDRCALLGHGRIVFDGTPAAFGADAALSREWLEV